MMLQPKKFVHLFTYDEISSTMDEAAKKVEEGFVDGLVVTAKSQTKGRGRNGKSFLSPKDLGLWVTLGFAVEEKKPFDMIRNFSVALAALLKQEYQLDAKIKWPNDIYCNGKKLCGLLAEFHKNQRTLLLGFGLNVNQTNDDFDSSIKNIATSVFLETKRKYPLEILLDDILIAFETALSEEDEVIHQFYKDYSLICGCDALLDNRKVFIASIEKDGSLLIKRNNEFVKVYAGDLLPISSI